ncbi:MAG: M56 family metallopeptidase [Chitinophagales bacterium]
MASYIIQSNITFCIAGILYLLFLRKGMPATVQRGYLLIAGGVSLLFPLWLSAGAGNKLTLDLPVVQVGLQHVLRTVDQATQTPDHYSWIWIYTIPSAIIVLVLWIQYFLLSRRIFSGKGTWVNGVFIIYEREGSEPASFFKTIFLPIGLEPQAESMILKHETAHAQQWHSLDNIFYSMLKIVFWCNPLVWFLHSELRLVHECLADKQAGMDRRDDYQNLLIGTAIFHSPRILTNNFSNSNLKRRLMMFNEKQSVRKAFLRMALVLPVFCFCGLIQMHAQSAGDNSNSKMVYSEPQVMPEYPGGTAALAEFLASQIEYPKDAKKNGVEGNVFVSFVVTAEGKVTGVQLKRGVMGALDDEAIRVVKLMPDWTPGTINGKPVDVEMVLPVAFRLK